MIILIGFNLVFLLKYLLLFLEKCLRNINILKNVKNSIPNIFNLNNINFFPNIFSNEGFQRK